MSGSMSGLYKLTRMLGFILLEKNELFTVALTYPFSTTKINFNAKINFADKMYLSL